MKSTSGIATALLGVVVGVLLSAGFGDRRADAQAANQAPAQGPRFQVRAYAGSAGSYGCFTLDTVTGELWHTAQQGQRRKVGDKLP